MANVGPRLFALLLAASICSANAATERVDVKTASVGTPLQAAGKGQTIRAARFFATPHNQKIGVREDGLWCSVANELRFSQALATVIMNNAVGVVRRELEQAGFPRYVESAFQAAGADAGVEYELAATLVDVQMNVCGSPMEAKGALWVQLDWELFSPRERRVVYRASHAGSALSESRIEVNELYRQALVSATRNLLADARFHSQATQAAGTAPPAAAAALAVLLRPSAGAAAAERMPALQSAVATVFTGAGSGSAFLVSASGHWLTNWHVVGEAKFVKIKLANGRELLGEVLRSLALRDVALLKTEAVSLAPLAIADVDARVGDDVLALGSPLGESFAGSVTRGVLSSFRDHEGQRWIQSDAQVLPGSSGGPLLNAQGAVIGITSRGIAGLNLFVPVRDAMRVLQLDFVPR